MFRSRTTHYTKLEHSMFFIMKPHEFEKYLRFEIGRTQWKLVNKAYARFICKTYVIHRNEDFQSLNFYVRNFASSIFQKYFLFRRTFHITGMAQYSDCSLIQNDTFGGVNGFISDFTHSVYCWALHVVVKSTANCKFDCKVKMNFGNKCWIALCKKSLFRTLCIQKSK